MNKLREALEDVVEQIEMEYGESSTTKIIKEFLSKPIRNCDVGTAEEQMERHYVFCSRNIKCHPDSNRCMMCYAKWAQMPYES